MKTDLQKLRSLATRQGFYDHFMPISYDTCLKEAWKLIEATTNVDILDCGCGSARILDHAHQLGLHAKSYTALDIDQKVFGVVSKRSKKLEKTKIRYVNLDICKPDIFFTTKKFDRILCLFTLYILPKNQQEEVLHRFYKMLKKSGKLLLTVPNNSYSAESIVTQETTNYLENKNIFIKFYSNKFRQPLLKKWLKKIQSNINEGIFTSYDKDTFSQYLQNIGFKVLQIKETYANNANHFLLKKE